MHPPVQEEIYGTDPRRASHPRTHRSGGRCPSTGLPVHRPLAVLDRHRPRRLDHPRRNGRRRAGAPCPARRTALRPPGGRLDDRRRLLERDGPARHRQQGRRRRTPSCPTTGLSEASDVRRQLRRRTATRLAAVPDDVRPHVPRRHRRRNLRSRPPSHPRLRRSDGDQGATRAPRRTSAIQVERLAAAEADIEASIAHFRTSIAELYAHVDDGRDQLDQRHRFRRDQVRATGRCVEAIDRLFLTPVRPRWGRTTRSPAPGETSTSPAPTSATTARSRTRRGAPTASADRSRPASRSDRARRAAPRATWWA